MAKQVDLSYEHYFEGDDGAISFAIFNKDIESFVQTTVINNPDFDALGIPMPEFDPNNPGQALVPGIYETKTNNAEGGYVRGFEAALTKTFSFLPGIWSGLGTNLSYSYTKSEIEQTNSLSGSSRTISLPGLSPKVISATLYFDYDQFSTRISARYRDAFIGEQVAVETQLAYYSDETVLDYQAGYKVTENLDVLFQVNNLTDEPTQTYFGNEAQTGTLQYFGRQYYFGLNYSM
jgi:TonB-dependent receptor